MMRLAAPGTRRLGAAICGALSLAHYASFAVAPSLNSLKNRFESEYAAYLKTGIHVMASQHQRGEVTIGDSHEYGDTPQPFDSTLINNLILSYLGRFTHLTNLPVIETWNGVYAKITTADTHIVLSPEPGVTIINGLGGDGMTFSFALTADIIQDARIV